MTIEIMNGKKKITASKEVLNEISMWARAYANEEARKNHKALAELGDEVSDTIYYALDEIGYYDDYK